MQVDKTPGRREIVLLQAICNNERGWAKVASQMGRTSLIQQGFGRVEHIEVWESGKCTYCGPEIKIQRRLKFLDEPTFGFTESLSALRHCWPVLKSQRTDLIIANANAIAMAALFLRLIGRTGKVVCLVSDYFPPHGKWTVRLYRRISAGLTRFLCWLADEAWALSPRIPTVKANKRNYVVSLYINNDAIPPKPREEVVYIGVPSPDHALDILFDICKRHRLKLNVVGESQYLQTIRHLAPADAVFHGLVTDPDKLKAICAHCFCGYAVYRNMGPQNYSYYGAPSKTLSYFASNTPVITTDTADFSKYVQQYGIGHLVQPTTDQIEHAVLDLKKRYGEFSRAIDGFRQKWNAGVESFYRERISEILK